MFDSSKAYSFLYPKIVSVRGRQNRRAILWRTAAPLFTSVAILLGTFSFVPSTQAAIWSDSTGGSFQDGTNWFGGVSPGAADLALFDLSSQTYTVDFTADVTNSRLVVGRSDVTFDLGAFDYDLTSATPESIFVGEITSDDGVLTLLKGTLSGVDATIGSLAGSTGELNLTTNATLTLSKDLWVGELGSGDMNVTSGTVNSNAAQIAKDAGSSGDVLMDGSGANWTNGNSILMGAGTSTLTVLNGAVLNSNRLTIGSQFTSVADVRLEGPDSQINLMGTLTLSNLGGTTTMTVRDGADLTTGDGIVGNLGVGADAQFLITGVGSTWVSTGKIHAGLRADAPGGILRIEEGAIVTSVTGVIALSSDGTGSALIDGAGSAWNMSGDLDIGNGAATLEITNGASVENAAADIDTASPEWPINILVDGGGSTWTNTGAVTGGNGATMILQDGGIVLSDSADISLQLEMDGPGTRWQITNDFETSSSSTAIIRNGAALLSRNAHLKAGDTLISNGTWTNTETLTVDQSSGASLRIADGGSVLSQEVVLVDTQSRSANVIVEGVSSQLLVFDEFKIANAAEAFGSGGIATLTIRDGGLVSSGNSTAATVADTTAIIHVEGNNTRWDIGGNLVLGGADLTTAGGSASLTIVSDAVVQVDATTKIFAGSNVQILGGTLSVLDSDNFLIDSAAGFDFQFGTLQYRGNATISFADTQKILGTVPTLGVAKTIEVGGTATLNTSLIIDGGTLSVGQLQGTSKPLFLSGTLSLMNGNLTVGTGGLLGTDLTLHSNRVLNIGNSLTVNAGRLLTIDQTTLTASSLTNNGEVVLSGAASLLNGGIFDNEGHLSGSGRLGMSLNNALGGVIHVASGNHLIAAGAQNFNSGRMDLTGGTLEFTQFVQNNSDGLIVGQGSIIARSILVNDGDILLSGSSNFIGDVTNNGSGLILVAGAGPTTFFDNVSNNGDIRTSPGATTVFLGSVDGVGSFTGTGTNRFEGDFTPGASPADISLSGDMVLTESALLEIELASNGGTAGTDFDHLSIAGNMDLGGTLQISLISGYVPSLGDSFLILSAGSRDGMFDNLLGTNVGSGLRMDVLYGLDNVMLQVVSAFLPGDYDRDGDVDAADYTLWQNTFGQMVGSPGDAADGNVDGIINAADYTVWRDQLPVAAVSVPEPSGMALALFAMMMATPQHRQAARR